MGDGGAGESTVSNTERRENEGDEKRRKIFKDSSAPGFTEREREKNVAPITHFSVF